MKKKQYDFIYLTNSPSFYKLNLCHEIAREHSMLLVFYGYDSAAVNTVLTDEQGWNFDYHFLHEGDVNKRSFFLTFIRLLQLMRRVEARVVLYVGWMAMEYNLFSFLSSRHRNAVVCESSILDVPMAGFKGMVKRAIISRMGAALPSGKLHDALFESVRFRGKRNITGGVGLFHKGERQLSEVSHAPLRYLYVGRLVEVKNISLLIKEFNLNGKPLTIVGLGKLEAELKAAAHRNINFTGFVDNKQLGEVYMNHDVFILPSSYEPWGLVVEEALYWGIPVIVSDRVGSSVDMVQDLGTGCIFESDNQKSLHSAILRMEEYYAEYRQAARNVDWKERERSQIAAFTSLLDETHIEE